MAAAEQKKSYAVIKAFKGVNTKANRTAIEEDQFSWLENAMPIGYANLKVTPTYSQMGITFTKTVSAMFTVNIGLNDWDFAWRLQAGESFDTPASFDDVQKAGSLLGSAGLIVLNDTVCMVWLAKNLLYFYRHESCGKCTPCREGGDWLFKLLTRIEQGEGQARDIDLLFGVASKICRPFASVTTIGDEPKSQSTPRSFGQFSVAKQGEDPVSFFI